MAVMAIVFGGVAQYLTVSMTPGPAQESSPVPALETASGLVRVGFWVVIVSLTVGMSVLRWPQLVRPAALCFLAKALEHGLLIASGLVGIGLESIALFGTPWNPSTGLMRQCAAGGAMVQLADESLASIGVITSMFLNILWSLSFLFFYLYLGRRAWRVDSEFRKMAAPALRSAKPPWMRRISGTIAWLVAGTAALALIGLQLNVLSQRAIGVTTAIREGTGSSARVDRAVFARRMSENAWRIAMDPDAGKSVKAAAVSSALDALAVEPENPDFLKTLGVALYKTDDFSAAIGELKHSVQLRPDATASFFLAMAFARLNDLETAQKFFDQADELLKTQPSHERELDRIREQAAAALFLADHAAKSSQSKQDQGAAKPK